MNNPDATTPNGARTPTSAAEVAQAIPDAQTKPTAKAAPATNVAVRAPEEAALDWRATIAWGTVAVASFHLAFLFPSLAFLIAFYLLAAFRLAAVATPRRAMWAGVTVGMLCFGPQLGFFYTIFGFSAVALWAVLAFWLGMYVLTQHLVRARLGIQRATWLAPALWLGFEFFRSELYFLRFTWLSAGYAFAEGPNLALIYWTGVYGVGFLIMAIVTWSTLLRNSPWQPATGLLIPMLASLCNFTFGSSTATPVDAKPLRIAAVQIEHKHDLEVLEALKLLRAKHPDAGLLALSELAFDGPVPARVRKWCVQENIHLVAGGKAPVSADGKAFYNSVFVIGPDGNVLHQQAKTIPIQFMADGQPAPYQTLWDSPWGKLGFCICYDKSFTRVTDQLVRLGAQALIVPTADEIEWGAYEHRLHARIAPVRAAEHRLPVLRVASSGISQLIALDGRVLATAPFPGELALLNGTLYVGPTGRIPPDRWLGVICAWSSWMLLAAFAIASLRSRNPPSPSAS